MMRIRRHHVIGFVVALPFFVAAAVLYGKSREVARTFPPGTNVAEINWTGQILGKSYSFQQYPPGSMPYF